MSEEKKDPDAFRMTFTGHLEELRRRLLICALALVVGMGVSYAYRDVLFTFILNPLFVARENVYGSADDGTPQSNDDRSPEKASSLALDAEKMSRRALSTDDPAEAARLAAKAAGSLAKAVEILESSEEQRAADERRARQRSIAYTDPVKPFWVSLKLALVGGICLSFGIILWELWAFIAPGLYPTEKRYAAPFIFSATACFLGGAYFGYRFVFPLGFGFLVRFSSQIAESQGIAMMDVTTVDAFVGIALKLLIAFGLVFELPVIISFLAMAGIVDHKQLWRFGRWFVVIAVGLGAMLTPPDVISQVMMAVPMSVLYLISIGLAYILHPARRRRREAAKVAEAAESPDEKPPASESAPESEPPESKPPESKPPESKPPDDELAG